MSTLTHIHRIKSIEAKSRKGTDWLSIKDDKGNEVALFVDAHEAEALSDAWADCQVEPEPLTAEDLTRGEKFRRDMIDAGRGHLLGEA